jgi:hypothetical protein
LSLKSLVFEFVPMKLFQCKYDFFKPKVCVSRVILIQTKSCDFLILVDLSVNEESGFIQQCNGLMDSFNSVMD